MIKRSEIRLLWHSNYYDGPLSGMCLYQNRKCWFDFISDEWTPDLSDENSEDDDDVWPERIRTYNLIELTQEQIDEQEYWHSLFKEKVGTHCDYDQNEKRVSSSIRNQQSWDEFYEVYKIRGPVDYSGNKVIGQFEW